MRALCKTWTEGSPAAFAVLDGVGDWTGDNQLCVTQEGQTPMIGQWTTVTNWTTKGSPYLWWTGPDQATVLQAVVNWGLSADLLAGKTVGVIAGDRASDQLALKQYLLPDLSRAGVTPVVKTIASEPVGHGHHGHPGPARRPAAAHGRGHLGHPADPVQCVLPGAAGRDGSAVLPPPPPERLRVEHRDLARPAARSLRQGPRRPGGSDHRDAQRHRRRPTPEPGRLRHRRAQLLDRVAQGLSPGAAGQPVRLHRRAGPHRGLVPGHPSVRHGGQRRPAATSTGGPSSPPCPRSRTSPAPTRRSSVTAPTSATGRPSTRWCGCTSTRRCRPSARCPRTTSPSSPAG